MTNRGMISLVNFFFAPVIHSITQPHSVAIACFHKTFHGSRQLKSVIAGMMFVIG